MPAFISSIKNESTRKALQGLQKLQISQYNNLKSFILKEASSVLKCSALISRFPISIFFVSVLLAILERKMSLSGRLLNITNIVWVSILCKAAFLFVFREIKSNEMRAIGSEMTFFPFIVKQSLYSLKQSNFFSLQSKKKFRTKVLINYFIKFIVNKMQKLLIFTILDMLFNANFTWVNIVCFKTQGRLNLLTWLLIFNKKERLPFSFSFVPQKDQRNLLYSCNKQHVLPCCCCC